MVEFSPSARRNRLALESLEDAGAQVSLTKVKQDDKGFN